MYTVEWLRAAMEEMDDLFLLENEAMQFRLVAIVRGIERALAGAPNELGESRDEGGRLAFFELLAVRFVVDESLRSVRITGVKRYGK